MTRSTQSAGDLTPGEYEALANFRFQIRRFLHFSEEQARSSGLEPRQHQALLAIKGLPTGQNATIGEISKRLQLRHHSAVELVDRLAAQGLVKRTPSKSDRRAVLIEVTRSGETLLRKLAMVHREELGKAGVELSQALRIILRRRGRTSSARRSTEAA